MDNVFYVINDNKVELSNGKEYSLVDFIDVLVNYINQLEKNRDGAIEYINNHQPVFELSSKEQIQEWFEKEYYIELLKILKGEDK